MDMRECLPCRQNQKKVEMRRSSIIQMKQWSSGSAEGWLRTKIIVLSMLTRLAVIELLKALHKAGVTLTLENDRAATAFHRGYIETIAVY
ncbi:hypothetical protein Q9966_009198 [Columba livia]|nr:hypothetical protein Q9966_009198 [Columba livia]